MSAYSNVRVILTDIEGTTTSVAFVYEVLFPYARRHLAEFIRQHQQDPGVLTELSAVRSEMGDDDMSLAAVISTLLQWMDEDRKARPLKSLQGMIWKHGYESGGFSGHVYPDALENLRRWHEQGMRLCVYSSGSVAAQQLLFGFSDYGDLRPLFEAYFDTAVGAKREVESYRAIAGQLQTGAAAILFLSDICEELDAAASAGMQTGWLVRGDTLVSQCPYQKFASFAEISILPAG